MCTVFPLVAHLDSNWVLLAFFRAWLAWNATRLYAFLLASAHLDTGWVYSRFSARSAPGMLFRRIFSFDTTVIVNFDFTTVGIKYLSSKEILCFAWVNRRREIPGAPGDPT